MSTYYNEIDPYAAQWLRNLVVARLIAPGEVDERSIKEVRPSDVIGRTQCHWFAGIGGWSYALRLAGWPDERPVWTGSCPCQPFSEAGRQRANADSRHLWPEFRRLIAECNPATVFGEQTSSALGRRWLDAVLFDLENLGFAVAAADLPAAGVAAPHRRNRLWFVADAHSEGRQAVIPVRRPQKSLQASVHAVGGGADISERAAGTDEYQAAERRPWQFEPDIQRVVDGVRARVEQLSAFGNAIVPQVAAEFIGAYLDCQP